MSPEDISENFGDSRHCKNLKLIMVIPTISRTEHLKLLRVQTENCESRIH